MPTKTTPFPAATGVDPAAARSRDRRLAVAAASGFALVTAFQVALAAGAPLGVAAWSGAHPGRLPDELRVASSVSAVVWLLAALVVLARGGVGVRLPARVGRTGVRALVGLLGLGAVMNAASSSPWERFGWAPFVVVLLVLCVLLARRGPRDAVPA
ncbi:hypothetical protein [Cellulomonas cellasea]|uniref:Integral membrane protein n=2 Tax=Cellulomonas cellasea TaxID=43670 RepID=A0A0A0B6Y8_9CELL|nr:hypothetical protein [Cellulomonas cellasea]KGM01569.1 hypothetical protein Q760_18580 [Cellulomonas cellasea DSM 20118]GEA87899.1 hypothetical protein CCE01nite_18480 [Cellulomonas cellasea]